MKTTYKDYELDDSFERIDFDIVESWLTEAYWSPGIEKKEIVKGSINSSIVVGCYYKNTLIGFLRVISDKTRFAYLLDVYVEKRHRRRGIAKAMVKFVMEHPAYTDVYQWMLRTRDAQPVYEKLGFKSLDGHEEWMIIDKGRTR